MSRAFTLRWYFLLVELRDLFVHLRITDMSELAAASAPHGSDDRGRTFPDLISSADLSWPASPEHAGKGEHFNAYPNFTQGAREPAFLNRLSIDHPMPPSTIYEPSTELVYRIASIPADGIGPR
jgi:hypothetical protein